MIADARTLTDMADACRRAADPLLVLAAEVRECVAACPNAGAGLLLAAADLGAFASHLEQAAQYLRGEAEDSELQAILQHRAQGGSVTCHPPGVVVRQEVDEALLPPDHPGLRAWLGRRFGFGRKVA